MTIALKATCAAETSDKRPILIVTSYNPDTRNVADNLRTFNEEYAKLGGKWSVSVEYLNCRNLPEAAEWQGRMAEILGTYARRDNKPLLVITLGIEAGAAYLMQTSEFAMATPVIMGMRSTTNIDLPSDTTDITKWQPESRDITTDYPNFNVVGGVLYDYDFESNLELVSKAFPKVKKIHFLSDNTLGGLNMLAFVKKEVERMKLGNIDFLDGRVLTFGDMYNRVEAMHSDEGVLIGTWRIDAMNNYVFGNTTLGLCNVNSKLPVITMSSVGLGSWALGGRCPEFRNVGDSLASIAVRYLNGEIHGTAFEIVNNEYVYDYNRLHDYDINAYDLPQGNVINRPPSFIERYRTEVYIVGIVMTMLVFGLIISFVYIYRIKAMARMLEQRTKEMEAARDNAEEANRLKTAFIANLSHEVRTPLNAIVGFTDLLLKNNEDLSPAERREFSGIISSNSDILLKIINDMLEMSKFDAGNVNYHYEPCRINDICRTQLSSVSRIAKGDSIDYRFTTTLPDAFVIDADPVRLNQLIGNLLSNAVKFTDKGFILISVGMATDDTVEICVKDSGKGIPTEQAEKIFDRFVKLDEFKPGTGIGLSICRKIVTEFGGSIRLDQSYSDGALFVVSIPVKHI